MAQARDQGRGRFDPDVFESEDHRPSNFGVFLMPQRFGESLKGGLGIRPEERETECSRPSQALYFTFS